MCCIGLGREVVVLGTDNGMLACKVSQVWGNVAGRGWGCLTAA